MLYTVFNLLWKWQKLDANFSSAAMGHTFSRLEAWDKCYKNFISVCHFFYFARSYKCCLENFDLAKVVKHCKNKKKCGYSS